MGLWDKKAWQRRGGTFGDRTVPARLDIYGDVAKGRELRGYAMSQLNMLEQQQRVPQAWLTRKLPGGVVIQIYSGPTLKQISIHVPVCEGVKPEDKEKKCFCTCHLAVGQIVNYNRYACYDFMSTATVYDVEVCHAGNPYRYTLLSGVRPIRHIPFENEQWVLVVFEPDDPSDPYMTGPENGCHMVRCRITDINHQEKGFYFR